MGKPRAVLADDHTLVLEAFKRLLEPEVEIVATVADGLALIATATQLKPDLIILDLGMPRLNGMNAGPELKRCLPKCKLIVLTMSEDYDLAAEAMRRWASAYLLKKSASSELLGAIRKVLAGESYVTPCVAQHLLDDFIRDPRSERVKHLTPRQREVLQLLAEGRTMKEAAALLQVTARTVAFHKYKIMEEFGIQTNSELVRFAIREHLVAQL